MNIGNVGPDITHEHPEYAAKRAMWRQYRDLYAGGEQFITRADQYLVRRQKEPGDVYAGTTEPKLLRKLCRIDCGLVYSDALSEGAGSEF